MQADDTRHAPPLSAAPTSRARSSASRPSCASSSRRSPQLRRLRDQRHAGARRPAQRGARPAAASQRSSGRSPRPRRPPRLVTLGTADGDRSPGAGRDRSDRRGSCARFARPRCPRSRTSRGALTSLATSTGGIERLMDYVFFQVDRAINGFDRFGPLPARRTDREPLLRLRHHPGRRLQRECTRRARPRRARCSANTGRQRPSSPRSREAGHEPGGGRRRRDRTGARPAIAPAHRPLVAGQRQPTVLQNNAGGRGAASPRVGAAERARPRRSTICWATADEPAAQRELTGSPVLVGAAHVPGHDRGRVPLVQREQRPAVRARPTT